MEPDRIEPPDTTIDLRGPASNDPDLAIGKHRRVIDLASHSDLLEAFDEDERVMEALLASLPPAVEESRGRHRRIG